jgi:hypothetical protein
MSFIIPFEYRFGKNFGYNWLSTGDRQSANSGRFKGKIMPVLYFSLFLLKTRKSDEKPIFQYWLEFPAKAFLGYRY